MARKHVITVGTRARMQRLSDAKLSNGWIHDLSSTGVTIRCNGDSVYDPGDMLAVEAFGLRHNVAFQALICEAHHEFMLVGIVGELEGCEATAPIRLAVESYPTIIHFGDRTTYGTAVDISPSGVGIRLPDEIPRGQPVTLELTANTGHLEMCGEVRYCRKLPKADGFCRVGIELDLSDRLTRAKWQRQFDLVDC